MYFNEIKFIENNMRQRLFSIALFCLTVISFYSCSDNVVADFSYSPESPRRGEYVTFTNLTTGDEDWEVEYWNWSYGDGYTSTSKSPKHIYQDAGKYKVTLMVDSNKHYTKTMEVIVYDSIPVIITDVDSVFYYKNAVFSSLAYNPDAEDVTYEWTFSENAVGDSIVNGKSTAEEVEVYFTKRNVNEIVKLHIEIGDSIYDVVDTVYIHDVKARSILMAEKGGNILRQRILDNGFEDYTNTGVDAGKHPFNISALSNLLYIFDAGTNVNYKADWLTNTSGDGNIRKVNLSTKASTEIINNNGKSSHFGFFNGYVDNNNIYWTDFSEFLYQTPQNSSLGSFDWNGSTDAQTTVPYYLAKTDRLGYFGNGMAANQFSGGIAYYDQAYFWAKGGTGKGIYRFMKSDILNANTTGNASIPSLGAILTGFSIRAFAIDEINQKIYFSATAPADKVGLWVANMSGSGATRIDNAPMDDESLYITGIAIDNVSNRVYWAYRSPETIGASAPVGTWQSYYAANPTHKTGIKMAQLATQYTPIGKVEYFREGVSAYGIALDEVGKY